MNASWCTKERQQIAAGNLKKVLAARGYTFAQRDTIANLEYLFNHLYKHEQLEAMVKRVGTQQILPAMLYVNFCSLEIEFFDASTGETVFEEDLNMPFLEANLISFGKTFASSAKNYWTEKLKEHIMVATIVSRQQPLSPKEQRKENKKLEKYNQLISLADEFIDNWQR
jgi:hypothetical protein